MKNVLFALTIIYLVSLGDCLPQVHTIDGQVHEPIRLVVNKSNEYVIYYKAFLSRNPYRIQVSSRNADPYNPVLVVARQEKEIISWQVPLLVKTFKGQNKYYNVTSRTMCHTKMDEINTLNFNSFRSAIFYQSFTVAISSSCNSNTEVLVETLEETEFYATDLKNTSLIVSPSQPRYVFYRFNYRNRDTLNIEIDSNDDVCLIVSIQDSYCPVFDLNRNIKYKGKYQTISRKGGLTIKSSDFLDGFFLVFVAQPDNYECTEERSIHPVARYYFERESGAISNVSFFIRDSLDRQHYFYASVVTLIAFLLIYIFAIALVVLFRKYGSMRNLKGSNLDICLWERNVDEPLPRSPTDISCVLEKPELNVKLLTKYPLRDKKRSFNYLWHTISIAIFYGIPVVQLVITYQRMLNSTGDQDLCYYNFRCAHPLFKFSDFNHIFSNIGYFFMGILFLFTTLYRQSVVPFRLEVGIPVHYGLFYAMGVALIIEGLLSACYHICPTQSNYQFDTSFMYVMVVLCMVKLYQNRHPDLNATAYATFSVLGFGIFLATLGILNGSLIIWFIFVAVYCTLCVYLSFKIYFLSFIIQGFIKLRNDLFANGLTKETFEPVKKARFLVLLAVNLINIGMLIYGMFAYSSGQTDFGTFLLGLLMANSVLHVLFYTIMKVVNGERICIEAIVYGALCIVTWIAATIFFLDPATIWTVTPAESRQWNQNCIAMDFFDKHDIWHLLSAPALYFTFMYLMCLDDDIIAKKQELIPVF